MSAAIDYTREDELFAEIRALRETIRSLERKKRDLALRLEASDDKVRELGGQVTIFREMIDPAGNYPCHLVYEECGRMYLEAFSTETEAMVAMQGKEALGCPCAMFRQLDSFDPES